MMARKPFETLIRARWEGERFQVRNVQGELRELDVGPQ